MLKEPVLDYLPKAYHEKDFGIGFIGAGGIAEIGHIPAFIKAKYRIAAVADNSEKRLEFSRATMGLNSSQLYSDYRKMLEQTDVDIVDITIPHNSPHKEKIVHDAIDAGKHVLVEKPISMDYQEARKIVEHADKAGVKLAVCHQYRWMPVFRAVKNMIDQNFLGDIYLISFDERWAYDIPGLSFSEQSQVLFFIESIHFIDQFRWWTGREPKSIFASVMRRPDQKIKGDTNGTLMLEMDTNCRIIYNGNIATHPQAQQLRFRLEGTEGVINAHFDNLWSPGGFEYIPAENESLWYKPSLEGQGFPDGYIGLMADLMDSIATDREPAVSGKDNLKTMQIVCGAYLSAELGRVVTPADIDPEPL